MDDRLYKRLEKIEASIERLREVEGEFLHLEAHKSVLLSQIMLSIKEKIEADPTKRPPSMAELEMRAKSTSDWTNFTNGLVKAETNFNHERRMYELRLKAYDAEHLTLKTETPVIKRQGVG